MNTESNKEKLLHTINATAAALLAPMDNDAFEPSLLTGMELMAHCVEADRVHIWRNELIDGVLCYVNMFHWRNDTGEKARPTAEKRPYSEHPGWEEKFMKNECVNGPLSSLTSGEQATLAPQGIKSLLAIPLFLNRKLYGFFSFDDCSRERTFSKDEVEILRTAGVMIVSAINNHEQTAQLRVAHERSQVLLDAMSISCYFWSKDYQPFDCNEETVKMFKLKDKQEILDRFFDLSPEYQPDGQLSSEKATKQIKKAFDEGKNVFEWMHQRLDGTPMPTEVTLVRVNVGDEHFVAAYVRDLREYKKMMEGIEQRDKLLYTVNSAAAVLLQSQAEEFDKDIQSCMGMIGKAVSANRVCIWKNYDKDNHLCCTQIYEWVDNTRAQLHSEITIDLPYHENFPVWETIFSQRKSINSLVRDLSPNESRLLAAQGILSVFAAPIFVHDQFWGFIGFDNCLQERLFSEGEQSILSSSGLLLANALLHNNMMTDIRTGAAKLEGIINNYSGVIWCVDLDNMVTLFNGQHLSTLGLTPEAFEGKNLDDVLRENNIFELSPCIERTIIEGSQDFNIEHDNKTYRIRSTPIYDTLGKVTSVVGCFDDITERTRLQEDLKNALKDAQAANEAKSSFLANMSHEMRTPLNAVIGLSGLTLQAGGLSEEAGINLEKVYNAGTTLLSTVNDILDISKIEAGKLELVPVEYDIPSLINDAITQSIMRIGEKPIKFVLDINENLPARLYGDDLRIKQVLNNLLSNAFKYTNEGTVELRISCERDAKQNDSVWMTASVRDTGKGIHSEDIGRLFSDYAQTDALSNRGIEGTGLGLTITKKVVELMDGTISVESEYGKGSVFTMKIRQRFVNDAVIGAELVNNLKNFHYSDNKRNRNLRITRIKMPYARVLVVDDVATNLDVAKGMMKPYGMQIDCVTSGQEAVDLIRADKVRYNAIFMDHMMPVMDGIEAARIIREEIGTEYAKTVPIIALTANAIVGNREMFLSKGFQAFLSKPIENANLDAVLMEWVRNEALEKEMGLSAEPAQEPGSAEEWQIPGGPIEGLDTKKGLLRFGGNREFYLNVLKSYAANTPPLLEKASAVNRENLPDYAIIVHGIKGSSRAINAEPVGAKAEALEKAAKQGDLDFVMANNNGFIEAAEKLIDGLKKTLEIIASESPRPKKDKPDSEVLTRLHAACHAYDMDEIDAVMTEINKYQYEGDDGLAAWLQENVKLMNFVQIAEKLAALVT